jgi:hypothetical protein
MAREVIESDVSHCQKQIQKKHSSSFKIHGYTQTHVVKV